ncbi:unnamed protein product [Gongylonema pulchrum]|uniref:WD_REPEATS_REGION domain-containing protein n=1 Tax=Gongylonema pulchrum TaxID=637853 RepID=A0A3P6PV48_9BILA|nr:unnamed protein product [Gongylonema pulchrum]
MASVLSCGRPPHFRHIVAKMNGERILAGGSSDSVMQFDYTGQHVTSVKTPLSSIYSIQTNLSIPNGMTAVAGDSPLISIFLNLGYVAFNFSAASDHTVPQ